jgi:hypothetical protein
VEKDQAVTLISVAVVVVDIPQTPLKVQPLTSVEDLQVLTIMLVIGMPQVLMALQELEEQDNIHLTITET